MGKIVIAVDGQSGCGKSSTAKEVARILGYTYLDSGAMYRAMTYHYLRHPFDLNDSSQIEESLSNFQLEFRNNPQSGLQETFLNGQNIEQEIRKMEVSSRVSEVAAIGQIRKFMVRRQRELGDAKGVVMDGRDIGSVVFPKAELKLFMTADLDTRARRRMAELSEKGGVVSFEEIKANLAERDKKDSTRSESPLIKVEDAVEIDTSNLRFEEQVQRVVDLAKDRIEKEESYASNN